MVDYLETFKVALKRLGESASSCALIMTKVYK